MYVIEVARMRAEARELCERFDKGPRWEATFELFLKVKKLAMHEDC